MQLSCHRLSAQNREPTNCRDPNSDLDLAKVQAAHIGIWHGINIYPLFSGHSSHQFILFYKPSFQNGKPSKSNCSTLESLVFCYTFTNYVSQWFYLGQGSLPLRFHYCYNVFSAVGGTSSFRKELISFIGYLSPPRLAGLTTRNCCFWPNSSVWVVYLN